MSELERKRLLQKKLELQKAQLELRSDLPHLYGLPHYKWSRRFMDSTNSQTFLTAANQIGKAEPIWQEIPTPHGFVKMGELKVGDKVLGLDGKPQTVLAIPFEGEQRLYRITFSTGESVVVGEQHLWSAKGPEARFRKSSKRYGKLEVVSTIELFKHYSKEKFHNRDKFVLPIAGPAQFDGEISFDAYFYGVWLGNGGGGAITLNKQDEDIAERIKAYCYTRKSYPDKILLGVPSAYQNLPYWGGLSYEKQIDPRFLVARESERRSLLAGLLDTDGTNCVGGAEFSSSSKVLANQVVELCWSLGYIAQVKRKKAGYKKDGVYVECKDSYLVRIWSNECPFWSKRKSEKWATTSRYAFERVIEKIEPYGRDMCRCITVSNSDSIYLTTRHYIPTHNSSVQIKRFIHWGTESELWPRLWPKVRPNQFWYLMPNRETCTIEVEKKWIPEFLPRGKQKDSVKYGWEPEYKKGDIFAIHFRSGVSIYFKTYATSVHNLQSGTVSYLGFDEELPPELYPELLMRTSATRGYMSGVFTPTLNSKFWYDVMEARGSKEKLPNAEKIRASLFDCLQYEDGSPSPWTIDEINKRINQCGSETEVQRRIYGRFVSEEGLILSSFSRLKNLKQPEPVPSDWLWYSGTDIGSSGKSGHLSGITFLAVRPDYKQARIVLCWRSDRSSETTASDIVKKYLELRHELGIDDKMSGEFYDFASAEYGIAAQRAGIPVQKAEKSHDIGFNTINSLFKNEMLTIDDTEANMDLIEEIGMLRHGIKKNKAQDDAVDSARYAISKIPWDMTGVTGSRIIKPEMIVHPSKLVRGEQMPGLYDMDESDFIEEMNSLYGVD